MMSFASDAIHWIYQHETLTAGLLALLAALGTIVVLSHQIQQSNRHYELQRRKKLESARAILPLALSRLIHYAENALAFSQIGKKTLADEDVHEETPPHIPDDVVEVLREIIEYADSVEVGHALRKLISELQWHHARMLDLPRQTEIVEPSGRHRMASPEDYDQGIWDAVHLYVHTMSFFYYARFETELLPEESTDDEVRKRLEFLDIPIPEIKRIRNNQDEAGLIA